MKNKFTAKWWVSLERQNEYVKKQHVGENADSNLSKVHRDKKKIYFTINLSWFLSPVFFIVDHFQRMNPPTNSIFSPYLLSRFHQHLNHLNDMAFAHTKILQEIMEKHSNEPRTSSSSPRGSISSSPSSSSSTIDSIQQRKRSYLSMDDQQNKNENHLNKRPRKQSKPQQLIQTEHSKLNEQSSEEEEIGEIIEPMEKPVWFWWESFRWNLCLHF